MMEMIKSVLKKACNCFKRETKYKEFPGMVRVSCYNPIDGTVYVEQ